MISRQHRLFSFAIACISRVLIVRDWLFIRMPREQSAAPPQSTVSRHRIPSGENMLDAVFVTPAAAPRASLLLCHGIGETVTRWLSVQQLLATQGVATLVFDYAGYGRSKGDFTTPQAEQDAICAFLLLQALTEPLPVSLLGFSLGSGIAVAIIDKVPAHRLILCAAFTSLRKAAVSAGVPRAFAFTVPDVWDAQQALSNCAVPVLIVHCEKDRLFPVSMAEELSRFCNPQAKFVVIPKLTHNQPFRLPELAYWGRIVDWLLQYSD